MELLLHFLIKPSATYFGHMFKCVVTKKVFIAIVVQYLCPLRKNQCFSCGIVSGESGLSIAFTIGVAKIISTTAVIRQATFWVILRTAFILLDVVTTRPIQVWTAQQFLMVVDFMVAVIHGH